MKEWKLRQEIYHLLNTEHADQTTDENTIWMDDVSDDAVINQVIEYFSIIPEKVIQPAKDYFVAIVYSRLLRDHFDESPLDVLDDPLLLYGNSPNFYRYSESKKIYDSVLSKIGWDFSLETGEIPDVVEYFNAEFMIQANA